MKTLAPFVISCLVLLGVVLWMFLPSATPMATDSRCRTKPKSPAPRAAIAPGSALGRPAWTAEPVAPAPGDKPTTPTQTRHADASRASSPAVDESAVAPEDSPESLVHWAPDDPSGAEKRRFVELRAILASDPDNAAALEAALGLARDLEWHNEACDLLARLTRLRPEDTALRFELAVLLMRLQRWLEAVAELRRVAEQQPQNVAVCYNLAVAHQALGHLADARRVWSRVIELDPGNPDAHAHRGEVLLDLQAWAAALEDFEAAIRLETGPTSVDAVMNLSLAYWRLGQLRDARACLLDIIEEHPRHVPLLNRLAEITWALHESAPQDEHVFADETARYCRRSLAIADKQPEVRELLERAK